MNEFERQVYADMKSTDRILLWMAKCIELLEFSDILTKEDIKGIVRVLQAHEKEGVQHELR